MEGTIFSYVPMREGKYHSLPPGFYGKCIGGIISYSMQAQSAMRDGISKLKEDTFKQEMTKLKEDIKQEMMV